MAIEFGDAFLKLTGNPPFPWQEALYQRFIGDKPGGIPVSCNLPTGLGKTSVVAVWLIALAHRPDRMPRRLVYVVNRRTVVDQTTTEVQRYREALVTDALKGIHDPLAKLCVLPLCDDESSSPLALSTLRGQFADNREWCADPARPAVIVGTVDMIGSRLLFSGYGVGFKSKPLHAGFLGQDVLLVHDEAHLEPAFQKLIEAIEKEQSDHEVDVPWPKLRVMELSATSRGTKDVFSLTDQDHENIIVRKRFGAPKAMRLHKAKDDKKQAEDIIDLALGFKDSKRAVLVFVRTVEDVMKVCDRLVKEKLAVETLTGTMRGKERDELIDKPVFQRFLPGAVNGHETAYLVCTSAGEVGVNISADHMVCDLSTFESMAQRFGRVNRFGERDDTQIHVVYPTKFDDADNLEQRRRSTLKLLEVLNGDGSPKALSELDPEARRNAFAPTPEILPTSDILFDAWALTTIRSKLPGRPPVEPYLHGRSEWEPPETYVVWREEVGVITDKLRDHYQPEDLNELFKELLEDYPLKPHEMLRDNSNRVFDRLKKLKADSNTAVCLMSDNGTVEVTTMQKLVDSGKESLSFKTVLLPPSAGGIENGLLTAASTLADDVADELYDTQGRKRRVRLWEDDPRSDQIRKTMRLIRVIDTEPDTENEDTGEEGSMRRRFWYWFELPEGADGEGSKVSKQPVAWQDHTDDVTKNAKRIVEALPLNDELKAAITLAAKLHDLGKKRTLWQRSIGNPTPTKWLAKSGGKMKPRELGDSYRHEFGSLVDVLDPNQPYLREFTALSDDMREVVLHLIAVHHGFGRPHFPTEFAFDPEPKGANVDVIASAVPQRFARLQRKHGRWGLAYLESLLRAADYSASANPSKFEEEAQ